MIVGVPEVGLVSTIAASYLKDQLKLPEVGFIDSELLPQVSSHFRRG
jgi:predicted ATP-grasp superfamily ATP-dependent carboligase